MITWGCVLLFAGHALAQDAPSMFAVYQDNVMPSKDAQFNDGVKKLKAAVEQNKIDFKWTTYGFDDGSYAHVVPISNFAQLDKNPFAPLETKIGKEALAGLWSTIDQCIESQSTSIIVRMPEYSYLSSTAEDAFRDITYWYVLPDKEAEAGKLFAEWKQLHETKKDGQGYSVYKGVFGNERGGYLIISWGKTILDWATKRQKSNEILGDDATKLWTKTMAISRKYYSKKAWLQKDLTNNPPAQMATK